MSTRTNSWRSVRVYAVLFVVCAVATVAAAAPPAPRRPGPAVTTPAAAKAALVGTWDTTPMPDEITLMAMDQMQDPDVARLRALGARVTYTFEPGGALRIVILSRQGAMDGPTIARLRPQVMEATWDVVANAKGLLLKVTLTNNGKSLDQPLAFDGEDALVVETGLLEHQGFSSTLRFRRDIGQRVTRWLGANNSVGGAKSPLVADLAKIIAPFVAAREDFRVHLGGGLTRSGKATELFAFCEQLFVRELTDAEVARLKLAKAGVRTAHWPRDDAFPVLTEVTASEGPTFDAKGGQIDLRKPITGTVTYAEVNRLPRDAAYLVRVSIVVGDQMIRAYHHSVSPRGGAATWKFSVNPPNDLAGDAGPVHLFVDLCRETKFAGADVVLQVLSPAADARFEAGR